MQTELYKDDHIYLVCGSAQLEEMTNQGWSLVRVLSEVRHSENMNEETVFNPRTSENGYYPADHDGIRKTWVFGPPTQYSTFLLSKPRGDYNRMNELTKKVEELSQTTQSEKKRADKLDEDLRVEKARGEGNLKAAQTERARIQDRLTTTETAKQKYEEDFQKLRKQLGEKTIKEALEA